MRIKPMTHMYAKTFAAIAFFLCPLMVRATSSASTTATTNASSPAALAQVVFPLDQFASADGGYRCTFFGNAFFINEDGYLITAAHVLSAFRDGGQPYILAGPPAGPRRLLKASIVTVDWEHDVAVLRATPNPFQGGNKIAYLPLSTETPLQGKAVLADSLLSSDVENTYSLAAPLEDYSRGEVLDYKFHQDEGALDSELLIFNHEVLPGQSGSPLVSADSQGVVGVIVGQWLHPTVIPSAAKGSTLMLSPGAALRIHYAISLLQQQHILWHAAAESLALLQAVPQPAPQQATGFTPPTPLSVVGAPYPPQALFGGEVVLDALIGSNGDVADVKVVSGGSPFLETALSAVHTWSFLPAQMDGRAVEGRIGIVFQFPQSFLPAMTSGERMYAEPSADSTDRGALPAVTVEPDYPVNSVAQGSVVLYHLVDSEGQITSTSVLRGVDALTEAAVAASHQWEFAAGARAGEATDSAVIVVETFRRPTVRPR